MPVTLILGPANAAKAGEVLGAYASASRHGGLLVVPTQADAEYYGRELAHEGVVLGSVITFTGLAGEIARRTGYRQARISELGRERLMRRVVHQHTFDALGESATSPGFAVAACALVAELERTLITPQRFASALRTWAAEDRRRDAYARDLSALYRGYAAELERVGRADREVFAWRALDALRAAPGRWGPAPVLFYGFDDLDPLQRDAVETLARVVGVPVTVSLTYEPGRMAFAARAETVEALRPLADRVLELPALDEHYEPGSRAALHHLERSLFEPPGERLDPGSAVRLLETGGMRAEAELIAAEVLALLRQGIAAEEIAILCRSLARSAPVLERVFTQYELPAAIERRVPFAHTALGRALLGLCRCAWMTEAPASELLRYLRYPGVLDVPELADGLERDVRREGIISAPQARERLGWELGEVDALHDAGDPAAQLERQARRLFARPLRGLAARLEAGEELDARALAALLGALGELRELGEPLSGPDLLELMEELQVGAGAPQRAGAVLVADPLSVRARRFRAVFVCGLQEGEFPAPGSPEPFLSDERRRELAACSGLRLAPGEDALARERYLFYACVSRATEQLILSYRSSDEEGNIELRSPFISDVADLLSDGWVQRRRKRLLADVVWPPELAPTARELARGQASAGAAPAGEVPVPERRLGPQALSHVRHSEILSGGALETYGDCPVRWLVERELAPERFERESEPVARGNYMHALMEELLRRLEGPLTAASLPRARQILAELLDELPSALAPGRSETVRSATRRAIEADLERYLRHEAADACEWPPYGLELRFGFAEEEESLPAVELEGGVRLRGMIDRLDVDPAGSGRAIVRDYKSGRGQPAWAAARWEPDRRLQVPLYMLAVRRLLGLEPVAGLYQPLGGDNLRARGVFVKDAGAGSCLYANDGRTAQELDELLADAERRAVDLAARLRGGELEPCPQNCSRDGCRYPGICRSQ